MKRDLQKIRNSGTANEKVMLDMIPEELLTQEMEMVFYYHLKRHLLISTRKMIGKSQIL